MARGGLRLDQGILGLGCAVLSARSQQNRGLYASSRPLVKPCQRLLLHRGTHM